MKAFASGWLALLMLPCVVGTASPITIRASGVISSTDLPADFALGQAFVMTYTYESETPDRLPDDVQRGAYELSGMGGTLKIGAYHLEFTGGGIIVDNRTPIASGLSPDRYSFNATQCPLGQFCSSVTGDKVGDLSPASVNLSLSNPDGTAFSSDALPLVSPPLSFFPATPLIDTDGNRHIALSFAREIGCCAAFGVSRVVGNITSLQVVPIPPAVWLFGSALGVLGWMRRKITS